MAQESDCKRDGCGFNPHSRKWNIYLNVYFHFCACFRGKARRWVPPLNTVMRNRVSVHSVPSAYSAVCGLQRETDLIFFLFLKLKLKEIVHLPVSSLHSIAMAAALVSFPSNTLMMSALRRQLRMRQVTLLKSRKSLKIKIGSNLWKQHWNRIGKCAIYIGIIGFQWIDIWLGIFFCFTLNPVW